MHPLTVTCSHSALRFSLRFAGGQCTLKIGLGDLQIMTISNRRAVADPARHNMQRERSGQFRLSGCPQVVPQARPCRQACPFDRGLQRLPKGRAGHLAQERQNIHLPLRRIIEHLLQRLGNLSEQRDDPLTVAGVVFSLG
ncbi:MAG: hypothetical protein IT445_09595 [Phycisphaeraceae bacterium]|nr:hypothetical protein [Phycisphaeraceae bacterium]